MNGVAEPAPEPAPALLETRNVSKHYAAGSDFLRAVARRPPDLLRAVDDVSIRIERGETLGLVGESGSGKSTLGRLVLQLEPPTSGDILYDGRSVLGRRARETRELRKRIQVVFQDPYSSLNPTMTVRQTLEEVLRVHRLAPRDARRDRVEELLDTVGLAPGSRTESRTSSAAASVSGSGSPARSLWSRSSSWPTRPSRHSTCRFRPRC